MTSIKNTYLDFYRFLRNPTNKQAEDQTFKNRFNKLLAILILEIPIIAIIGSSIYAIEKAGLINTGNHKINISFQQLPIWRFVLFSVVLQPFFEELLFRFFLRFSPRDFTHYSIFPSSFFSKKVLQQFEYLWVRNFRLVFFFSAIAFGYFHLPNYDLSISTILLSPFLVAPQIIAGLFLGYMRIRYNFMLAYFMHAIHNAFFISVSLLFFKG